MERKQNKFALFRIKSESVQISKTSQMWKQFNDITK